MATNGDWRFRRNRLTTDHFRDAQALSKQSQARIEAKHFQADLSKNSKSLKLGDKRIECTH